MADVTITTIIWAILTGIVPTFLWLWFWFTQDKETDNFGFLLFLYVLGMGGIIPILPLRGIVEQLGIPLQEHIFIFAAAEEIVKVGITALVAFRARKIKKPTDYVLYLVTVALGFAALENTLYLLLPISQSNFILTLFTGNLRFIGSTLLHTICVAVVGIFLGLSYYEKRITQWIHGILGLGIGIGLHAVFNYFIIESTIMSLISLWLIGMVIYFLYKKIQKNHQYRETEIS